MNRNPNLDELVGTDTTGAERERLQHVHDLLLEAGPPPELSPELEAGPNLKMTVGKRRRVVKQVADPALDDQHVTVHGDAEPAFDRWE